MKVLVVSDIHSNLAAFSAVLEDAGEFDTVWCLGDVVGYGPQPNECIERLLSLPHICTVGNHDLAAIGRIDTSLFNSDAQVAAEWTARQLTVRHRAFLESLPEKHVADRFTLVHGSPRYPVWEYVTSCSIAASNLDLLATPYCFVGHSHMPAVFYRGRPQGPCSMVVPSAGDVVVLHGQAILNPGGVGQPRDGDPRASYALLQLPEGELEFRRVEYDIARTQDLMGKAHLPSRLSSRLSIGW